MRPPVEMFLSASAQRENLGDLVLRRQMIRWLSADPAHTHVFVGAMPGQYVAQLELGGFAVYDDVGRWIRQLLSAAARGKVALVFSPGHQGLILRRLEFLHGLVNLLLATAVRLRGGPVLKVGRSLEGPSRLMLLLEQLLRRLCTGYWLRDGHGVRLLGGGVETMPDMAVGSQPIPPADRERTLLVMSWRYDRPVPEPVVRAVIQVASARGLEPVLLTQVWTDGPGHERLSQRFGLRHIAWRGEDHGAQILVVEEILAQAVAVMSNRLHALIFGWNRGAVPIGYSSLQDQKIWTHLEELGLRGFVLRDGDEALLERLLVTEADAALQDSRAAFARCLERLESVRAQVLHAVGQDGERPATRAAAASSIARLWRRS